MSKFPFFRQYINMRRLMLYLVFFITFVAIMLAIMIFCVPMEVKYVCLINIKQTSNPTLVLDDKINKLVIHKGIKECHFTIGDKIFNGHIGTYYDDSLLHYYWLLTDEDLSYNDGTYNTIVNFNYVSIFDYLYYLGW